MIDLEAIQNLSSKQKQLISSALLANQGEFEDEKQSATFGGILKQFALGAVNSALLDLPKFLTDREGEDVFKASGSQAERIARGTGTALGFVLGAPAKLFAKGTQIGGKFAIQKVAGTSLSKATKKTIVAATKGSVGVAALEAATLPTGEETFFDKAVSVPVTAGIGAAFGLTEAALAPVMRPHLKKLQESMSSAGKKKYTDVMDALSSSVSEYSKSLDKKLIESIQSGKLKEANDFILEAYAGAKQKIARTRIRLANIERLKNNEKFQKIMRSGNAAYIADAQLIDIIPRTNIPESVRNSLTAAVNIARSNSWMTSAGVQLSRMGQSARQIAKRGFYIRDVGERNAGGAIADFRMAINGLSRAEKDNVRDMMMGNVTHPITPKAHEAASQIMQIMGKVVGQAKDLKIQVKRKRNGTFVMDEFRPRKNPFPHLVIDPNSDKKVVQEVLKAAHKRGDFNSIEEAQATWKAFRNLVTKKRKQGSEKFLDYMIRSGQARDRNHAYKLMTDGDSFVSRMRTQRFGNLEHERSVNIPFYDVDLQRAMERYLYGAHKRLAEVRMFGQNHEILSRLTQQAKLEGADEIVLKEIVKRFTGATLAEPAFGILSPEVSGTIRAVQTITKLGLAVIPNATQSINTAMVSGVGNTIKAIRSSLSGKTQAEAADFALRSSATLEASINQYIKGLGLDGSFEIFGRRISATGFLEKTGFIWMERMNRTIASNAGKNYAIQMGNRLVKNPSDNLAKKALRQMKINPEKVIQQNGVDFDDMLKASQYLSNKTQFRSGPLDLPLFFTSPEGKVLMQFKTFGFNQAKLIKDLLKDEVSRGNFRPLAVALTAMPILGEGVKDVRGILTGQVRDQKGLDRLLDNISAVGAAGVLNDMWASAKYNNIEGWLLGPTGSDISKLVEGTQRFTEGRPKSIQRLFLRNIPVVGPRLQNEFVPSNHQRKLRERRDRERDKARKTNPSSQLLSNR